jgi:hypothetical protein
MADKSGFVELFHEYLGKVDEVTHLVLNGHLEVESELDDVLRAIFFHPEILQDAHLTFLQKAQIARAHAMRKTDWPQWDIIVGLNSLRNHIAHGKKTDERTDQIHDLRRHLLAFGTAEFQKEVRAAGESQLVVFAAAVASGFLLEVKDELIKLRWYIDLLDERLHPKMERVPLYARKEGA